MNKVQHLMRINYLSICFIPQRSTTKCLLPMVGASKRNHNLRSKDTWVICNLSMILYFNHASKRKNLCAIKLNQLPMPRKESKPILTLKTVTAAAVMSFANSALNNKRDIAIIVLIANLKN